MTDTTTTVNIAQDPPAERQSAPKPASKVPRILVTVAAILAVVSIFSVWIRTQVLSTDAWVAFSDELLEEPAVQEALSTHLVETLYEQADIVASLEDRLPVGFEGLAAPIAGAVRGPAIEGVEKLLGSDRLRSAWESANRVAHEALVRVVRDETRQGISTSGGMIALDVKPMLAQAGATIGLSGERIGELPDDAGQIVVFESIELATAQRIVAAADAGVWLLLAVVALLYVLAVYLANGRRIQMLRTVGWSLVTVGVTVLVLRVIALRSVDTVVQDPDNQSLADIVASAASQLLQQMAWSVVIYGALVVLFTSLLGDHRWAVAARRTLAPLVAGSITSLIGATAIAILLLVWWSPGRAFEQWATALILAGVVIGAVATLRVQLLREFGASPVLANAGSAAASTTEAGPDP